MTLKWDELRKFIKNVDIKCGKPEKIRLIKIESEIRKEFGVSKYVINNIKEALKDCGFIKADESGAIGIFNINRDVVYGKSEKNINGNSESGSA